MEDYAEGSWLESIVVFRCAAAGDSRAGMRLVDTSVDAPRVMHGLLQMLSVYLRGEEQEKLDRFFDAAFAAGPPPALPAGGYAGDTRPEGRR